MVTIPTEEMRATAGELRAASEASGTLGWRTPAENTKGRSER